MVSILDVGNVGSEFASLRACSGFTRVGGKPRPRGARSLNMTANRTAREDKLLWKALRMPSYQTPLLVRAWQCNKMTCVECYRDVAESQQCTNILVYHRWVHCLYEQASSSHELCIDARLSTSRHLLSLEEGF
jgi:hypothetical protein